MAKKGHCSPSHITDAELALKKSCFLESARQTHVKVELADRNFDDPARFTLPTEEEHVPVSPSKAEVSRNVVHKCRLPISFPASQWFPDWSASVFMLLQAVHIPFSHRAHVFLTKDDVLYMFNLKCLRAITKHISDLVMFIATTVQKKWYGTPRHMRSGSGQGIFFSSA